MPAYPPAPWQLAGELTLIPIGVRADATRRFRTPGRLRVVAGRTLGGVMLVNYRAGTLTYNELIVFSGLATDGSRPGFVVSHIYVDSEPSLRGGREIWGLPKELAQFRPGEVRQGDAVLLRARLRHRRGLVALPLPAPTLGELAGRALYSLGTVRLRAAPALTTLEIPESSPFASLRLAGTRPALAGDFDLTMRAPLVRSPRRHAT